VALRETSWKAAGMIFAYQSGSLALMQGDSRGGDAIVANVAGDKLAFRKRVEARVV